MIKLVFCLRRLPELSFEDFQRYWRDVHGPLVRERAQALGVRRYVQAHTLRDPFNEALRCGRGGPEPYDGVAELWWDDYESLAPAVMSPDRRRAARELLEDERRFIDLARSPVWIAQEHLELGE